MPTSLAPRPSRQEFGTAAFRSLDELIAAGVQAASVAVPTAAHLEVARQLMRTAASTS